MDQLLIFLAGQHRVFVKVLVTPVTNQGLLEYITRNLAGTSK